MAIPLTQSALSRAVDDAFGKLRVLKQYAVQLKTQADASGASANQIVAFMRQAYAMAGLMNKLKGRAGLDAFGRTEFNDPALSLSIEFAGIEAACNSCVGWIEGNLPKDGAGYVLLFKVSGGDVVERNFPPAALASFSVVLGLLVTALG